MPTANSYTLVLHGGAGRAPDSPEWIEHRTAALKTALRIGRDLLAAGAPALDAVEASIRVLEDSPWFNAGRGAVLNADGRHELDASIMDGRTLACGAVGGVRTVRNPISLARRVMTDTRHVLLVTDGAEAFADGYQDDPAIERVPNGHFTTDHQRERLDAALEAARLEAHDAMGTVGAVARDRNGDLAAGTSTGGLVAKRFGRVGDSPIIGAGTYADNATAAVSCTGVGEDFIRHAVAYDITARIRLSGVSLVESVRTVLHDRDRTVRGGVIAVDRNGGVALDFNTPGMARAVADSDGRWEIRLAGHLPE